MITKLLSFLLFGLCILSTHTVNGQTCTLDVGGKNSRTIIDVFQLNEAQIGIMETLRGELVVETKGLEEQIEKLLAEQPQSTEEELIKLAENYKVLQQKVVDVSYEADKKMLSQFNPRQYERYLRLCKAAIRMPIKVIPKIYNDSISGGN